MSLASVEIKKYVVTIEADGALLFTPKTTAEEGTLKLASVEPPSTWRLVKVGFSQLILAMGDWLVWIDGDARKVARRVRARSNVKDLQVESGWVVARLDDGLTQTWSAQTGEPKVAAPVTALFGRADLLVTGDRSGRVRVLRSGADAGGFAAGEEVLGHHVTKRDVVVSATSRVLLRAARPWTSARPIALETPASAFAADDAYAFVGTKTGAVDVYELESGRAVTSYALCQDDRITALVRLPGALLAVGTGALDGRVLFVDVAEAEVVHRLTPHQEAFGVTCMATDPRGRIVASAGDDGMVVLLDPAKGRVLARLAVPETAISMAFEPSGRRIACAFANGSAAMLALTSSGAKLEPLDVRNVAQVAWAESGPVFGLEDGGVVRHAPSKPSAAAPTVGGR